MLHTIQYATVRTLPDTGFEKNEPRRAEAEHAATSGSRRLPTIQLGTE